MDSTVILGFITKVLGIAEIFSGIAMMAGNAVSLFFGIYSTTSTSREPAMLISFFAPGVAQIVSGIALFYLAEAIAQKLTRPKAGDRLTS